MAAAFVAGFFGIAFWLVPARWWGAGTPIPHWQRGVATGILLASLALWWRQDRWIDVGYMGLWIVVALIDARERIIPNRLVAASAAWSLVTIPWSGLSVTTSIACAMGLALTFLLIHFLTRGGIGMGDVKYSGAVGLALGWPLGLIALVIGIWAGGIYALILLLLRAVKRHDSIPLGPFLTFGAIIGLVGTMGH